MAHQCVLFSKKDAWNTNASKYLSSQKKRVSALSVQDFWLEAIFTLSWIYCSLAFPICFFTLRSIVKDLHSWKMCILKYFSMYLCAVYLIQTWSHNHFCGHDCELRLLIEARSEGNGFFWSPCAKPITSLGDKIISKYGWSHYAKMQIEFPVFIHLRILLGHSFNHCKHD